MITKIYIILFVIIGNTICNLNFLSDVPGEITMEYNCLPDVPFTITKAKPLPNFISRGSDMSFKAVGSFNQDTNVQKLRISTKINGITAQDIKVVLPNPGVQKKNVSFIYTYEDKVPAIAPAGYYESFMYLLNEFDKEVSCLKGSFTLE